MLVDNAGPSSQRWLKVTTMSLLFTTLASFLLFSKSKPPARFHLQDTLPSSLLSPPDSCPSPYDVGRPPMNREGQTCERIPSNNGVFGMELCRRPHTCNEFTFRIKRTNSTACTASEASPDPSRDPELSNWIKANRGPDAFLVRTDGAERYATVSDTYEGNCSYSFDIRLKNPGMVYLQVWWTFSVSFDLPWTFSERFICLTPER
ncbi:hypothetical protein FRC00_007306 [Tulasnella sp. 408]|nr:hypothetical protein FRC00_007306 [Tulasnella sp. 408]